MAARSVVCVRPFQRGMSRLARASRFTEQRKYQDNVYLLNYRPLPSHSYPDALAALRAFAISNLDETVELHLKVDMGVKKSKLNAFHGLLLLPKPYGKLKQVLVLAEGEAAETARNAGADYVGSGELIEKITKHEVKFDQCLSTPAMLGRIKHLQRTLKEKMPTIRRGTATNDLAPAIKLYKHGQVYKCDKNGFINCGIGKLSFSDQELRGNTLAVMQAVQSHRLSTKGEFFKRISLSSTHGPGLQLVPGEVIP